jgi:hypothetical protein
MATNEKVPDDINKLFKEFGFTPKQINEARQLHRNAIKHNKKYGGANPLQEFKKNFNFDEKTLRDIKLAHEAALKLNKTQKITTGGNYEGMSSLSSSPRSESLRSSPRSKSLRSSPRSKSPRSKSPRSKSPRSKSPRSSARSKSLQSETPHNNIPHNNIPHNKSTGDGKSSSSQRRTRKLTRYDENDLIDGNFHNLGKWFSGKISRVHPDGTYDIDYFDGRHEEKVDSVLIRMPAEQPQRYSMISTIGSLSIAIAGYGFGFSFFGISTSLVITGWKIIGQALDTYVDGQIMQNTDLVKICKLIEYVFPKALLMYLVYAIHYSQLIVNPVGAGMGAGTGGGGTEGAGMEGAGMEGGSVDASSVILAPILTEGWTDLLVKHIGYLINLAISMTGGVFGAAAVAWMGYFVYTRFSKNEDKNAELDRAIYSNHKRRFIIMERQKKLQKQKEKEAKEQQRHYQERLQKQLELEKKNLVKEEKKKANRYKFVRGQNDANSQYLFNRTLKRHSRTESNKADRKQ